MAPAYDPNRYQAEIAEARAVTGTPDTARQALEALDLTTLKDNDKRQGIETAAEMAAFLEVAKEPVDGSKIAAVCVYPNKIRAAKKALAGTGIGIATVVNFPLADDKVDKIKRDTAMAVKAGADEIDVVIPFKPTGQFRDHLQRMIPVKAVREAAPDAVIKVILETNQLQDPKEVYEASLDAIRGGANMLKTSTGKNDGDVTLEHAAAMLAAIRDSGEDVGLKISKGVKTNDQAAQYMALADKIMGAGFSANPEKFRFGASSLHAALAAEIRPAGATAKAGPDAGAKPGFPGSDY